MAFTKKRKYVKKPKNTLTKKVNKIAKVVKALNPEIKYYDVASASNVIDNNPTFVITPYRQIAVGTADFANRIGDKINSIAINLRSTWLLNGLYPYRVRMFCFIYKHNPDSVALNWSTIINLYLSSTYMNSVSAVLAERDYDNRKSFVTLFDEHRILNPTDTNASSTKKIIWDKYIKIPKKYQTVQYFNGGSNVAQNELFIGAIAENDTTVYMDYHYRWLYSDV